VPVVGCGEVKYYVRYILEFYLYFCLILVDYLILSGVEVVSELILLLILQIVLGSGMRKIAIVEENIWT